MITVRRAAAADIPWLVGELRAFSAFFGSARSVFPGDDAAARWLAEMLAAVPSSDPGYHPFFLAEKDGEPVGFIAGLLGPHFFNPAIVTLTELFWWVSPAHRRSMAGGVLFKEFESFGRAYADWIVFSLESTSPVNPDLLTRRGYTAREASYLFEVA